MTAPLTLWRLVGAPPTQGGERAALIRGLRQHLAHAPFWTLRMQITRVQQAYVALHGCAGCLRGRCVVGCYVSLFQRVLRLTLPHLQLHPVAQGFVQRPYTRLVLAVPREQGTTFPDHPFLAPWSDARLTLYWHTNANGRLQLGLLLLVGADGPDPRTVVAEAGWKVRRVMPWVHRRMLRATWPVELPVGGPWPDPQLLLPVMDEPQIAGNTIRLAPSASTHISIHTPPPGQTDAIGVLLRQAIAAGHAHGASGPIRSVADVPNVEPEAVPREGAHAGGEQEFPDVA